MAWPFGSKRVIHVATSATRLIEDALLPDLARTAPIDAVFRNRPIGRTVVDGILRGFVQRVERGYRYALLGETGGTTEDGAPGYTLGLPNHTIFSDSLGAADMLAHLEATHGETVNLVYHHFTELAPHHVGFARLAQDYGYDARTNELTAHTTLKGFPVHLENLVGVLDTRMGEAVVESDPGFEPFRTPKADAMALFEPAPNARYTPWANPEADEPVWAFEPVPATVRAHVAWRTDTPIPGSVTANNIAVYEQALAQAEADAATARSLADETDQAADPVLYASRQSAAYALELPLRLGTALAPPVTRVEDYEVLREVLDLGPFQNTELDADAPWFQTKYQTDLANPAGPRIRYATIRLGSGEVAALDALDARSAVPARFLPFVLFRESGMNLADASHHGTPRYETSVRLMQAFGLDYQGMADAIEANPDVGRIDTAAFLFAAPINATLPLQRRYLALFFHWLFLNDRGLASEVGGTLPGASGVPLELGAYAADSDFVSYAAENRAIRVDDGAFSMQLNYRAIRMNFVAGVIGAVDEATTATETEEVTYGVRYPVIGIVTVSETITVYVFRHQLSPGAYREIRVAAPTLYYGVGSERVEVHAVDEPEVRPDGVTVGIHRLLVPLNHDLVEAHFNPIERDRLYSASAVTVYNSRVVQRIRWYEREEFGIFLAILAVVLTVVSLGSAAPAIAAQYAAYAAAFGTVVGALLVALEILITHVVLDAAFSFVAREAGVEVALALAVVAATVGVSTFDTRGTWGTRLMMASTGLADAAVSEMGRQTREYVEATEALAEEYGARFEDIDEAREELASARLMTGLDVLDPLNLVRRSPLSVPGESPENFFNRTVHAGNPGALAFTHLEHFAEINLRLPRFEDTIRGFD